MAELITSNTVPMRRMRRTCSSMTPASNPFGKAHGGLICSQRIRRSRASKNCSDQTSCTSSRRAAAKFFSRTILSLESGTASCDRGVLAWGALTGKRLGTAGNGLEQLLGFSAGRVIGRQSCFQIFFQQSAGQIEISFRFQISLGPLELQLSVVGIEFCGSVKRFIALREA